MSFPVGNTAARLSKAKRFKPGDRALFEALSALCGGSLLKNAFHGVIEGMDIRVRLADQSQRFVLSVVCTDVGRFRITRSTPWDRWLGSLLPSLPLPSRDPRFDKDMCVQTRDLEVTSQLITNADVRRTIRSLLSGPGSSLALEDGRIKLLGARAALGKEPELDQILGLLRQLSELGERLTLFAKSHEVRPEPAHDSAKVIAWCLTIGLFVLGAGALLTASKLVPLLAGDRFLWMNLGVGLVLWPFLLFGLMHLIARRTAPARLFVPLTLLALFSCPLATTGGAYLLNGLLDEGSQEVRRAPIVDTHTYKQKSERRYQVGIASWWEPNDMRWFRVSHDIYEAVNAGGDWSMELTLRPGAFDEIWIQESTVLAPGQ